MNRRTFLRCLPAAPAAVAATPAAALQMGQPDEADAPAVGDEIDGREVLATCETCSKPLFEGDLRFSYYDGPDMCVEHAPTWNDLKNMQDEAIAAGEFEDQYEEMEDAKAARESVLARIAAGEGDIKFVWPL